MRKRPLPEEVRLFSAFHAHMKRERLQLDPTLSAKERQRHFCTVECPVFEQGDTLVCCRTGNVHICTPESCHRFVRRLDARFCATSRRSWPLEAEDSFDLLAKMPSTANGVEDSGEFEEFQEWPTEDEESDLEERETAEVKAEVEAPLLPVSGKHASDEELEQLAYQILRKLCLSRERQLLDLGHHRTTRKRIISAIRMYAYYCSSRNLQMELLSLVCIYLAANQRQSRHQSTWARSLQFVRQAVPQDVPEITDRLRYYAQQCVWYWRRLSPLVLKGRSRLRYRFPFHCLGYLYNLRKGAGSESVTILEADPFLDSLLPNVPHLNALEFTQKVFTQHKAEFLKRLIYYVTHVKGSDAEVPSARMTSVQAGMPRVK